MSKMIQIRHVPDEVHARLKRRAAEAGMSLSHYLRRELEAQALRPTLAELQERLAAHPPAEVSTDEIVRIIHEDRDAH
jgi:plasmid stability protein